MRARDVVRIRAANDLTPEEAGEIFAGCLNDLLRARSRSPKWMAQWIHMRWMPRDASGNFITIDCSRRLLP